MGADWWERVGGVGGVVVRGGRERIERKWTREWEGE